MGKEIGAHFQVARSQVSYQNSRIGERGLCKEVKPSGGVSNHDQFDLSRKKETRRNAAPAVKEGERSTC